MSFGKTLCKFTCLNSFIRGVKFAMFNMYRCRLGTSYHRKKKTNWEEYRNVIESKQNLNASLTNPTEIEGVLTSLIEMPTKTAHNSTPELQPSQQNHTHIHAEIKRLVGIKGRAIAKWHAPQDKTALNRATRQLKARLEDERDKSYYDYVTGLTRYDNSIWKSI